ncbi:MAG: PD40 domain-containing protein, partial [Bacteroidales bacterium]|nr:PD40 domain-containing protein [Bacteroidales bacterium]
NHATDGKPAWVGDRIFFLSDQGEKMRMNIWTYDIREKTSSQVTHMEDFDISFLSAGNNELVFEAGGILYLLDAATLQYKPVNVKVVSDLSLEMPRSVNVSKNIRNMSASPEGKRIVFEARGELFNVPVKEGYVINLTRSSGAFDMMPSWSPDGKQIAYWSDQSGEYEIYLQAAGKEVAPNKLTSRSKGFGYHLHWSPDSKKLAFIDEKNNVSIIDTESKVTTVAGKDSWNVGHGGRYSYTIAWSPDSKWLAFTLGQDNANNAIFLFDVDQGKAHQSTSGFYDDSQPIFSTDGKYLYFLTDRNLSATYSDMSDGTWVYPNATQVAAISLTTEIPTLLYPKNDAMKLQSEKEGKNERKKGESGDEVEKDSTKKVDVKIDLEDMESRLVILPPKAGNIGWLASFKGKLVYLRFPNTGSESLSASLVYYDLEKREEKTIIADVNDASLTADGKFILVSVKGKYGIVKPLEKQKVDKPIPTGDLVMDLVPSEEWKQIFLDTWRRYRDFFYDPEMHGVDWEEMKNRYGALLKDARSRWDVSNIQSNLAAELSAGHTYTFGGDTENTPMKFTGFLGIDWELDNKGYRIKRIVKPAAWDTEVRSPFDWPGVEVKEGDYIHSVNGVILDQGKDPYAAFEGLSGKTVSLTISSTGVRTEAKKVVVRC